MKSPLAKLFASTVFVLTILFVVKLSLKNFSFKAQTFGASAFVTFVSDFEDLSKSGYHDTFGWGGTDTLRTAVGELAPHLTLCRQYKLEDDGNYRFDVKVSVGVKKFRVVGILEGGEKNQKMASCLRDKINEAVVEKLTVLKPAAEDAYRLKIEVQGNVATQLSEAL